MKLRSLRISSFRAIDDLELRFDDALGRVRAVNVLAGPNGCGKTSVLFGIVQALRGAVGYRTDDVPVPCDFDIRTANLPPVSSQPIRASVQLEVEFDVVERTAIPQVFEDTCDLRPARESLPELPEGRIELEWNYPPRSYPDGSPRPSWHVTGTRPANALPWFSGFKYAVRGWRNRKLRSRNLLEQIGRLYLFPQDRGLRTRVLGEADELILDQGAPEVAGEPAEGRRQRDRGELSVYGILKYLSEFASGKRLERDEGAVLWEDRVKEAFNRICYPKVYLGFMYHRDSPTGAPYFKDGDSLYPLQMASSGEQVIIEYATHLSYPSAMNYSLVLIDEPELHLHPGWIRQLYRALPQIGIGNQYIMTTHSEDLRTLAAEDGTLITLGSLGTEER
jgi:hypothetical protein